MMRLLLPLLLGATGVSAFVPHPSTSRCSTALNDIAAWRDLVFNFPGTGDDRRLGMEEGAPPKEICILPFPFQEVLLQGETKQLRLYEERFIELFEDCMANHCGLVGMGLLAESGIIQTIPLCEIEAFNRMGEGFGIFVTIRVVGRAKLVDLIQQEPYIKAVCTEIADEIPPNLDLPNLVASNIENYMLLLSSMEHRLVQAGSENIDDGKEESEEMQRRINIAKLVSSVLPTTSYTYRACNSLHYCGSNSLSFTLLYRTIVSTMILMKMGTTTRRRKTILNPIDEQDSCEPIRWQWIRIHRDTFFQSRIQ